jgi:hypothetical protein
VNPPVDKDEDESLKIKKIQPIKRVDISADTQAKF